MSSTGTTSKQSTEVKKQQRKNSSTRSQTNSLLCYCNEPPVRLTVKKETKNKGRIFYKCAKPEGQQCKLYVWDDELPEGTRRAMAKPSTRYGGRDLRSRPGNPGTSESGGRAHPRCGRCRGVGHTMRSKNCPLYGRSAPSRRT